MGIDPQPHRWVHESQIADGARLIAHPAIVPCIAADQPVTVAINEDGGAWVPCSHGRHDLDALMDLGGSIVGFMLAYPAAAPEAFAEGAHA